MALVLQNLVIPIPSVDLHAQQQGLRPRAVFVHGFGGDGSTWDLLWNALGEEPSALHYDLRGFGRSVCPDHAPYTHAGDLLALLDARGIDDCDLVGVSMGGGIALNFTLDHPQRVRNLVLISPQLVAWEWSESWLALWRPIVAHARAGRMDAARQLWWQHPVFRTTRDSGGATALFESIMRFAGDQWIVDRHRPMLPDVERLHQLQTRTLLLTAGQDLEDFRLMADLIEGSAAHVERIDAPARGHLLTLEDPQGCADRIKSFLAAAPGG